MANTRSSKKRDRQARGRNKRNREQRSALRTAIRNARAAKQTGDPEPALREAERLLDRAARKHLIHANAAARTKARLRHAAAAEPKG